MQLNMVPDRIEKHPDHPSVTVVTHLDGSQIYYLHRENGLMAPGHLWQQVGQEGTPCLVTFFVPFGQAVMPVVIKVDVFDK